jgi:hypothetical protein
MNETNDPVKGTLHYALNKKKVWVWISFPGSDPRKNINQCLGIVPRKQLTKNVETLIKNAVELSASYYKARIAYALREFAIAE